MDVDITWWLLGLPLAFVLGWLASRFDLRQLRLENRQTPKAYFKGLNYLLSEQQDQAIDAFIEAVQNDPDTSELHFALGNLFRKRGDYDRAVRVHRHLLARADLSRPDHERAQHALAQDFLKAGLLDHAEQALHQLEGTAYESQARLALLSIYERSRDWQQAGLIAQKLQDTGAGSFTTRLAHYLCEQAASKLKLQDHAGTAQCLHEANALDPTAPRPLIELAQLQLDHGQADAAMRTLQTLRERCVQAFGLAAPLVVRAAQASGQIEQSLQMLRSHYEETATLDVLQALVQLDHSMGDKWYLRHLEHHPSLVATARWMTSPSGRGAAAAQPLVERALEQATLPLRRYRCAACGFEAQQYYWHCPGCLAWDSYPARRVEEL